MNCPSCKQKINVDHCKLLKAEIDESSKIETVVMKKALERSKHEGLHNDARLKVPGDAYYNKLQEYAMFKLAYYMCYKCKAPYFGGMKDCNDAANVEEDFKAEELVCPKCSSVGIKGGMKDCKKHGTDYIDFKCRYCCSIALWFCFGTTHFCDPCHRKAGNNKATACAGKSKKCPLKIEHPQNGEEYALGCSLCRE